MGRERAIDRQGKERRRQILVFLQEFVGREQMAPTLAEIAAGVGLGTTSAAQLHVDKLKAAGLLEAPAGGRRTLRLTAAGKQALAEPETLQ